MERARRSGNITMGRDNGSDTLHGLGQSVLRNDAAGLRGPSGWAMGLCRGRDKASLGCEGVVDRKRNQLWLCSEDEDWAMKYLRDQLNLKGVAAVASDDR